MSPIWEKDARSQEVYLPSWKPLARCLACEPVYNGGQTITVQASLHQIPLFIRDGSSIDLGDLNKEWQESMASASVKPDLKTLESEVVSWFNAVPRN